MVFNNLFADRQSDAIAGIFRAAVKPLEDIKDAVEVLGLNAYAVVADGEDPFLLVLFCADMDAWRFFFVEFNAITDQVLKKLKDLYFV